MPAPSVGFTVIASTDLDPDSPITTGLMTALYNNGVHLEEWLGKNYVAAVDHDHDGVNSARAAQAASWNLCMDPFPMTDISGPVDEWANFGGGTTIAARKGLMMQASGAYARTTLTGHDGYGDQSLGGGSDIVVAILVQPSSGLAAGQLRFGLSDGDNVNFKTGARAIAVHSDIPGPVRLWSKFPKSVGSFGTSFDLLLRVTSAFDAPIFISAIVAVPGQALPYMVFPASREFFFHRYNQTGKGTVPWLDQAIMMDDAVYIAPS